VTELLSLGDSRLSAEDLPELSLVEFLGGTAGLRSIVIGTSKDPNAKVTVLLVSERTGMPVMAVKVPTTSIAAAAVGSETAVLAALRARYSGAVLDTVPRVVRTLSIAGLRGVVMTAVPGTPMTSEYMRRGRSLRVRTDTHLTAVSAWLASFHGLTTVGSAPIEMDAGVTTGLRARFSDDERLPDDLARLAAIHATLRAESAARTAVHGDMWFGNVLVEGQRVTGVVDWEAACLHGEPVRDLARFAIMYALYLDHRTSGRLGGLGGRRPVPWGAGVEFALNGTGWFPERFRAFLQDGLRRLGASPDVWRDATLAGVAEVAARTDDPAYGRSHLELFRRLARNAAT
jgi:aminoglycoside phosphotransferase